MSPGDRTLWCHNCGVEILWAPLRAWGRYYCCQTCLRGDRCDCPQPPATEDDELVDDRRADVERAF